eukprot:TRINITY_DN8195_c0_g1_i3.p2 TRINITY_DN8195_c0_g1~~TRINITY_DN8195_c0_g1_i3.p2  ORF type:complete len:161 (+),score=19.99 TRINITY_DN8195_c0_g1_i3:180-662(+)
MHVAMAANNISEVYASGNKSQRILPELQRIGDNVLLTSVGDVGLRAHKLDTNTCVYSHREANLAASSVFCAGSLVEQDDGQMQLVGYFVDAESDAVVVRPSSSEASHRVPTATDVQALLSNSSLPHPIVIFKVVADLACKPRQQAQTCLFAGPDVGIRSH